jgi:hypothetical protein
MKLSQVTPLSFPNERPAIVIRSLRPVYVEQVQVSWRLMGRRSVQRRGLFIVSCLICLFSCVCVGGGGISCFYFLARFVFLQKVRIYFLSHHEDYQTQYRRCTHPGCMETQHWDGWEQFIFRYSTDTAFAAEVLSEVIQDKTVPLHNNQIFFFFQC